MPKEYAHCAAIDALRSTSMTNACYKSFLKRSVSALETAGCTNSVISPSSAAISRTKVEEINEYFSDGVRNKLSTLGANLRFILAN